MTLEMCIVMNWNKTKKNTERQLFIHIKNTEHLSIDLYWCLVDEIFLSNVMGIGNGDERLLIQN